MDSPSPLVKVASWTITLYIFYRLKCYYDYKKQLRDKKHILTSGEQNNDTNAEMRKYYKNGDFCDIILIAGVDNFRLPAHRMVLSASSGYFYTLFRSNFGDANASELVLEHLDGKTLKDIVDFMYMPIIEVMKDNVEDIMMAADYLQIKNLSTILCDFMVNQLDPSNCLKILFFAERHNLTKLLKKALTFTYLNFEQVTKEEEFLKMTEKQMLRFLGCNDIYVSSEKTILIGLVNWLKYDIDNRQKSLPALLQLIRFPFLKPTDILEYREFLCQTTNDRNIILDWLEYLLSPHSKTQIPHALKITRKSCKKLYYFTCGVDDISSVQEYDYGNKKWSVEKCPVPVRRKNFTSACVMGKMLLLGGGESDRLVVDCFNLQTMQWSNLPRMNRQHRDVGLCMFDGNLYAIGGCDPYLDFKNRVEKFDFRARTWTEMPLMMRLIKSPHAVEVDGVLYVICLDNSGFGCYDPRANKWFPLPTKNEFTITFGFGAVGGYLYAVGGMSPRGISRTVERFDPRTQEWKYVAPLKWGRYGISVTSFNNKLIACGGREGHEFSKIVQEYDPMTNKWRQLALLARRATPSSHAIVI